MFKEVKKEIIKSKKALPILRMIKSDPSKFLKNLNSISTDVLVLLLDEALDGINEEMDTINVAVGCKPRSDFSRFKDKKFILEGVVDRCIRHCNWFIKIDKNSKGGIHDENNRD